MKSKRRSGVLLHLTSLPGPGGIGSFGPEARTFLDFLHKSKQSLWQVLPIGPAAKGDSPYTSYSSFAGNPLLISLETVAKAGDLSPHDLEAALSGTLTQGSSGRIRYDVVNATKLPILREAASRFFSNASPARKEEFQTFCEGQKWLHDFALFMALKEYFEGEPWNLWPKALVRREPEALAIWSGKLRDAIAEQKYLQWQFFRQWHELKSYANRLGISIIGDLPIFVALESAEVWTDPDFFNLDGDMAPAALAGVPPDYFSETGQLWENPLYNWERIAAQGYRWWIERLRHGLQMYDMIRIDHFRGFEAFWEIPIAEKLAINGRWVKGPGVAFFEAVLKALGNPPIIAEDLGVITPEVEALRERFGFPGMKILQFAFGALPDPDNLYLPYNYTRSCVVYTGTHDNDTTLGWFQSLNDSQRKAVLLYLNQGSDDIVWHMIRLAFASVADYAVIPMQDLLELPTTARMNIPGQATGHWSWRCPADAFQEKLAEKLALLSETYGRNRRDTDA